MRGRTQYVDLLYFLVVMQLVTRRQTRAWLSPFQLAESLQAWLVIHRAKCEWRDRVWIGHASLQIAKSAGPADSAALAQPLAHAEPAPAPASPDASTDRAGLRMACIRYLREHV
ncbi:MULTISPECIES: hypothetical protein [Burkholderia]|nr:MULTISPECIES: hypothetical protein [Burkholderia]KVH10795.1 hypothetical protein WS85_15780 [Burkholderia anthina]KVH11033.1 hypothetical protein WS84_12185 [Burkholderia anthina]KVM86515.1 hypothetical protein WT06_24435 [Burkholderia anthina]KVN57716.1 hypothetical protein WT13_21465 [Burkholderia anthina]KVX37969.1 hypothetical protein WT32_09905 [Burkholderia anthina]